MAGAVSDWGAGLAKAGRTGRGEMKVKVRNLHFIVNAMGSLC